MVSINEEFRHEEKFDSPFQYSADWNFPPIYNTKLITDDNLLVISNLSSPFKKKKVICHLVKKLIDKIELRYMSSV